MKLPIYQLRFNKLALKYTWAISRNASDYKINAFVKITDGQHTGIGEAAPNIRYNETQEAFEAAFSTLRFSEVSNLSELIKLLDIHKLPNALRFGIESAYVHYLCAVQKMSVADFFELATPVPRNTSYTIPIMPVEALSGYFEEYGLERFSLLKIKVNQENLVDFVQELQKISSKKLIIDANEAYQDPDHFLADLELVLEEGIEFIEQPFPAGFHNEYRYLKSRTSLPLFADESVTNEADFEALQECFHGVNIKLMKAGGYVNGIRLLKEAKRYGMKTMMGCMVETGLGISSGFHLSSLADYLDLDSFMILKQDPYPLIKEKNGTLFLNEDAISPDFSLNSPV